ncbi:MAG: hypothetical protein HYV26_11595 [Candidatus Hydrogenedentes bacterium]|nr:hypothetical protein [Candidatus Hydrogenedentota bacterium]
MNAKNLLRNLLLVFACGSVVYLVAQEIRATRPNSTEIEEKGAPPREETPGSTVIVYYLSEGKDCAVCDNLESFTLETLQTYFASELASGRLTWRSLDMDDPQHAHYVTDFSLYTKSVVLAEMRDGKTARFKNLEDVWDHVYDKTTFIEYIRTEIAAFLEQVP